MQPDVSIIIPCYNSERTIADALDASLSQREVRVEVVVVDDCSTDGTLQIAKRHSSNRVRVIALDQNRGTACARNAGIDCATGQWLQFLDSDDLIAEDKCARQMADAGDADVVYSDWSVIDEASGREYPWPNTFKNAKRPLDQLIRSNPLPTPGAAIVRHVTVKRCGGFDSSIRYQEDWEFWVRLAAGGAVFKYVSGHLCTYRLYEGAKSYERLPTLRRSVETLQHIAGKPYAPPIQTALAQSLRRRQRDLAVLYCQAGDHQSAAAVIDAVQGGLSLLEAAEYRLAQAVVRSGLADRLGPRRLAKLARFHLQKLTG